ncbi:copper chaperone PCu(A)C [Corynebacterium sp. 335C]
MTIHRSTRILAAGTAALALALAGCSADEAKDAAADATSAVAGAAEEATSAAKGATDEAKAEAAVDLEDFYVKEMPEGKEMTAIFGTIVNEGKEDLTITSFSIEGLPEGTTYEQHETKDGVMQEVPGGLTVPAGGKLELAPGGDHFMIMNATKPLLAGDEVEMVLEFSDGTTVREDVEVRVQAAGEEDYGEDGQLVNPGDDEHAGHDHGDHAGHDHDHEGHDHDHGHEGHDH